MMGIHLNLTGRHIEMVDADIDSIVTDMKITSMDGESVKSEWFVGEQPTAFRATPTKAGVDTER